MKEFDTVSQTIESLAGCTRTTTKEHRAIAKKLEQAKDVPWLLDFVDAAISKDEMNSLKVACWILPACADSDIEGVWGRFLSIAESDMWEVKEEASHCFRLLAYGNPSYISSAEKDIDKLTVNQLRAIAVGYVRFISERYTLERKILRRIIEQCLATSNRRLHQLVARFVIGDYLFYCLPQEALRFSELWAKDGDGQEKMRLSAESLDASSASPFVGHFIHILSDMMRSTDRSTRQAATKSAKRHLIGPYAFDTSKSERRAKIGFSATDDPVQSFRDPIWLRQTYGRMVTDKLTEIAAKVPTPFTVICEGMMTHQIRTLQRKLSKNISLRFGGKAWFHPWIVSEVKECGLPICASSRYEAQIAHILGFKPQSICFMQPGCCENDLLEAQRNGFHITIDSESQADAICRSADLSKNRQIAIRLSLSYVPTPEEAIVRPTSPLRFGLPIDSIPPIVDKLRRHGYRITEVMGHAGSLIWRSTAYLSIVRELANVLPYLDEPVVLNIGGGLPFCYVDECDQININMFSEMLLEERQVIMSRLRKDVTIALEPARMLSAPCALQVTRITDIKQSHNSSRYLFCDAVLNSLGLSLPVTILGSSGGKESWTNDVVVSNLCAPDDSISEHVSGEAQIGDLAVVGGVGSYVLPLSHSLQARMKPTEVLLESNGNWSELRKPMPSLASFLYAQ